MNYTAEQVRNAAESELEEGRELRAQMLLDHAAQLEAPAVPRAWMRRWAFDGETPKKEKNANNKMAWPFKYKLQPVTEMKCLDDDVPLYLHRQLEAPALPDGWRDLLETIDRKAQAGLCQMGHIGTREFHKDIRKIVADALAAAPQPTFAELETVQPAEPAQPIKIGSLVTTNFDGSNGSNTYLVTAYGDRPSTFDIVRHPDDMAGDRWRNVPPSALTPVQQPAAPAAPAQEATGLDEDEILHKVLGFCAGKRDSHGTYEFTLPGLMLAIRAALQVKAPALSNNDYAVNEAKVKALTEYFKERPQLDSIDRRNVFSAGFKAAVDALQVKANAVPATPALSEAAWLEITDREGRAFITAAHETLERHWIDLGCKVERLYRGPALSQRPDDTELLRDCALAMESPDIRFMLRVKARLAARLGE